MTASNHVIAGALIGSIIVNPIVAIPVALGSHFIMDALPHWCGPISQISRAFKTYLITDIAIASLVMLSIVAFRPEHWPIMFLCAGFAASPDLMWLPGWIEDLKKLPKHRITTIERFHAWVQWGQFSWGFAVEAVWFVVTAAYLLSLV